MIKAHDILKPTQHTVTASELDRKMHPHSAHSDGQSTRSHGQSGSRVVKELHLKQLEDGTLHHEMRHPNGLQVFDTTHDLDLVHDLLEQHFGSENEGEEEHGADRASEHEEHSHY